MLSAFNVPTQNRFAQLDSDQESELKTKTKKSTPETSPAPPSSPLAATQQRREGQASQQERQAPRPVHQEPRAARPRFDGPSAATRGQTATVGGNGGGGRGRGGAFRGTRAPPGPRMFTGEQPPVSQADDEIVDADEKHVGSRPARHGNPRFDRGARVSAFRGREREYERRSGTGRGREIKKSGAGMHNWGTTEGLGEDQAIATEEGAEALLGEPPSSLPVSGAETPVEGQETQLTPEAEKPKEESEEDKYVDFSEWQKTQKQKRAQLLQEKQAAGGHARPVDAGDLEKEGYQIYEREETAEERQARELRMNHGAKISESEDEEDTHRPRTYNIFQFTGDYNRRGARGGRGGRGDRGGRGGRGDRDRPSEQRRPAPQQQPIVLDLGDKAAFPSLG